MDDNAITEYEKPIGRHALTAAERKREQRLRMETHIAERDRHEWTEQECLKVLSSSQWRGTVMDNSAWDQLGLLRGFIKKPAH